MMLEVSFHLDQRKQCKCEKRGEKKLKKWDDEENNNYQPTQGKAGKFLRFMMYGSMGLLSTFVGLYFMEWAMATPKITGGV